MSARPFPAPKVTLFPALTRRLFYRGRWTFNFSFQLFLDYFLFFGIPDAVENYVWGWEPVYPELSDSRFSFQGSHSALASRKQSKSHPLESTTYV